MSRQIVLVSLVLVCMLMLPLAAADTIIINSKEWKDVYSGMQYGYLNETSPKFLASEQHGTLIVNDIQAAEKLIVFSSSRRPFVIGYKNTMESMGYEADEFLFDSLSLELAKKLDTINKYVIVDGAYGYNALAVAPYAIVSKSFVLFADRANIAEVVDFLEEKSPEAVLIYGIVDREVREQLAQFSPEIINKDGDRFANNVEIVRKYKEIDDKTQVLLSNGEFIEAEIMAGSGPLLFIGNQNVPDKIREYIRESNIQVGVLIGNELVGTATTVRRQTGISTFVKFARSARTDQGPVAQIEGLDVFRVPKVQLSLALESATYNAITRQLEVTLRNNADVASYFKGTYTITSGEQEQVVGDVEPVFIESQSAKTVVYDLELIAGEEDIRARAFITYGESKDSLEFAINADVAVERVEINDLSAISIEKLEYSKPQREFHVFVENTGSEDAYIDTEVVDVLVIDTRRTFGSEEVIRLSPGQKKKSVIPVELEDEDLEKNPIIRVRAYYGKRENALAKVLEGEFELIVRSISVWTYVPILVIIILLILIIRKKAKARKKKANSN
ncbi:TPA: hypothetical protein HA361_01590 [Candidatus Woesearchaeota archaeon]|nr:hypothetical protein [Candidatus Woesearchaeota archaeon]HII69316.1 hypothetical protein [Candidatus Woesearchaeota archaeon]